PSTSNKLAQRMGFRNPTPAWFSARSPTLGRPPAAMATDRASNPLSPPETLEGTPLVSRRDCRFGPPRPALRLPRNSATPANARIQRKATCDFCPDPPCGWCCTRSIGIVETDLHSTARVSGREVDPLSQVGSTVGDVPNRGSDGHPGGQT